MAQSHNPTDIRIDGRTIGAGSPCYVIAEAGVNHNGDRGLAEKLIDAAADAGADAVKFQTFSAERLAAPSAAKAQYQKAWENGGETQFDMLKKLELSPGDHEHLMRHAARRRITFLSTPFDRSSADLLNALGVAAFKIGSGDLTDRLLLSHVARFGRPILLSSGGATLKDVRASLAVIKDAGDPPVALLHCVSMYPADIETVNLSAIATLAKTFKVPVGFSDHTTDCLAPVVAVALGARILEKHITLDRSMPGPDHSFSLEPAALKQMIAELRRAESSLGHGRKEPHAGELPIIEVVRKSLFAGRTIERGAIVSEADLVALRPSSGLSPMQMDRLVGRVAKDRIEAGALITPDMVGAKPAARR